MNKQKIETNLANRFLPNINNETYSSMPNCFAVILAGGEGLPRQGLIPKLLRGQRPPQFLKKAGEDFLINQTRELVATAFPAQKTFITVTETDSKYYEDVLADVPPRNLIVQPQDDGTTFEILYTAMRFAKVDPRAVLFFFPMDFSTSDDKTFIAHVESACSAVRQKPQLILMGIEPETSDSEFDWIEIDQSKSIDPGFKLWRILNFWHKPSALSDDQLKRSKFLLNRSILIGTASTFLKKIRRATPDIYARFAAIQSKIGTSEEEKAIRNIYYAHLSQSDFSKDVLEKNMDQLAVMPVSDAVSTCT
jgi:mannose-1-phosphate guanylyltransferase